MAVDERSLCMGCMSPNFEGGKCSVCGYDADTPVNLEYLPPRGILGGRYIVGKMVSNDPEGVWYVGFDKREELRVWIREYAPNVIVRRDHENFSIKPLASSEAQFKALMSDFEDLCHAIQQLPPTEKVIPISDIVHASNTVYAIYRYIKTISLESFLERSGGKLSWRHTKKLLMPLFHTVANVHKAGLIHRGLSPQTVQLDQSGTLWLSAFTIAAARTDRSELTAQLFPGYAAPEQYSLNSWQGTWTDVYALGAIAYRTVTGKQPVSAPERVYEEEMLDDMACMDLPETSVNAINKALAIEVEERTQTAERLIADLLATEGSNTAVYNAPSRPRYSEPELGAKQSVALQDREAQFEKMPYEDLTPVEAHAAPDRSHPAIKQRGNDKKESRNKKSHPALMLILSAVIAASLLGIVVFWIAHTYLDDLFTSTISSSSETENIGGIDFTEEEDADKDLVPRFVGANVDSIKSNEELQQRYRFVYEEEYNDDYEPGVIYEQQPLEGTKMPNVGTVTLYVSKGPEMVELPDIVGKPVDEALSILNAVGIKFTVIEVYNKDYDPDVVIRTEPKEAGAMLEKNKDTVMVYIKKIVESERNADEEEDEGDRKASSKNSSSRKITIRNEDGYYDENGEWITIYRGD